MSRCGCGASRGENMPTIAVCFFGITRNIKNTLDFTENFFLKEVARRDPGFRRFGHFNLIEKITNRRTGEEGVAVDTGDYKLLNCDYASCTDQSKFDGEINYGEFEGFGDSWNDGFVSLRNLIRQLYSLQCVTDLLVESGERFDLVIYSRPDIGFRSMLKMPKIRPNTLYTPWFDKYRGLNDRFAMGDFETMVKYGSRFSMMRHFCEETGSPLHSERFLLWYARQQGFRTADLTSIDFCRIRANGSIKAPDLSVGARLNYFFKRLLRDLKLRPC